MAAAVGGSPVHQKCHYCASKITTLPTRCWDCFKSVYCNPQCALQHYPQHFVACLNSLSTKFPEVDMTRIIATFTLMLQGVPSSTQDHQAVLAFRQKVNQWATSQPTGSKPA